jgi:anti-sigma B factor antagonist
MKPMSRQYGNVAIVDLPGRITHGDGDMEMREVIQDLLEKGNNSIILNMERVVYMDSAGIGELVACHKRVVEKGGTMKILKPNKKVLDLFTITKLIQLFDVYEDEKQALVSF